MRSRQIRESIHLLMQRNMSITRLCSSVWFNWTSDYRLNSQAVLITLHEESVLDDLIVVRFEGSLIRKVLGILFDRHLFLSKGFEFRTRPLLLCSKETLIFLIFLSRSFISDQCINRVSNQVIIFISHDQLVVVVISTKESLLVMNFLSHDFRRLNSSDLTSISTGRRIKISRAMLSWNQYHTGVLSSLNYRRYFFRPLL